MRAPAPSLLNIARAECIGRPAHGNSGGKPKMAFDLVVRGDLVLSDGILEGGYVAVRGA